MDKQRKMMTYFTVRSTAGVCAIAVVMRLAAAPSLSAATLPSGKHLLLDARVVESTEKTRLMLGPIKKCSHNPLFGADKPWEVRMDNLYPNVIYDPAARRYHCWYSPFIVDPATSNTPAAKRAESTYLDVLSHVGSDKREMAVCYATSADGIHWKKPEVGRYRFASSTQNNLVLRLPPHGPHGAGILHHDGNTLARRGFKMFFSLDRGLRLSDSTDGVRWSPPVDCPGVQVPGDTHNCLLWAPSLRKYIGFTRTWDGVRQVARTESADLKAWTPAEVVLQGPDPQHQTYAMQVFPYCGVYLGLLMVLDTQRDTVQCELAWSPDTIRWRHLCPGDALINNGDEESYDWGCVYASVPIVQEGRILLYYGGSNGRHGDWRDSYLCCAELPLDRWAGYKPEEAGATGSVTTRPLTLATGDIQLTADGENGAIRVFAIGIDGEVLAESEPISSIVTDCIVKWENPAGLDRLRGRSIRLRFQLNNATLYSFRLATPRIDKPSSD